MRDDAYQLDHLAKDVPAQQRRARTAVTTVDFLSNLDITSKAANVRLTGLICTIGPSSKKVDILYDMIEAGMNIARLNISHGTHKEHGEIIKNVRQAAKMFERESGFDPCIAIAIDTKGPEIRTGYLEGDDGMSTSEVWLEKGLLVKLTSNPEFKYKCTNKTIYLDYDNIAKVLIPGKRIFIDDGLISIVATEIGPDYVIGEVENAGFLGSKKGCNLPGTDIGLPGLSEQDILDIKFSVDQGVDAIFLSYVHGPECVRRVRELIRENDKSSLQHSVSIISKIEDELGCANVAEIIEASDGIVVARGDMGIEIPAEKVFIAQKQMIALSNRAGKPVIIATQMLESMTKTGLLPTRAESSDVANAILDGTDCTMLSGETAKGQFPVACINTMTAIAREAESCLWSERFFQDILRSELMSGRCDDKFDATHTTAISAVQAAYNIRAMAIVCLTTSGTTAHLISSTSKKHACPTIAVTRFPYVSRQMQFYRGIIPLHYQEDRIPDWSRDVDERIQFGVDFGKKSGFIKSGDPIVCITGWRKGAGSSNTVRILNVN